MQGIISLSSACEYRCTASKNAPRWSNSALNSATGRNSASVSGTCCLSAGAVASEDDFYPQHSLATDRRRLDHRSVLQDSRHRTNAAIQEYDILDRLIDEWNTCFGLVGTVRRCGRIRSKSARGKPARSLFSGRGSRGGGRTDAGRFGTHKPPDKMASMSLGRSAFAQSAAGSRKQDSSVSHGSRSLRPRRTDTASIESAQSASRRTTAGGDRRSLASPQRGQRKFT